ncbi:hypothetical protein, partial [Paenibacillus dendritiformis]|uniref:hypothetical protein n=1 Tax=Paenibacillus dendritiformis TaxID=130049 RepID=UPI001BCC5508
MSRKQRLRSLGNLLQLRDTAQCSQAREMYRRQYLRAKDILENENSSLRGRSRAELHTKHIFHRHCITLHHFIIGGLIMPVQITINGADA